MGTRSMIQFEDQYGNVAQVYKHSDGYPESVIPMLNELFEVLDATGSLRSADYTAANFVFYGKLRAMQRYVHSPATEMSRFDRGVKTSNPKRALDLTEYTNVDQPSFFLGYGLEEVGTLHGDEAHLYKVKYHRNRHTDAPAVIQIAHSDDFPRWDEADDLREQGADLWDEANFSNFVGIGAAGDRFTDST